MLIFITAIKENPASQRHDTIAKSVVRSNVKAVNYLKLAAHVVSDEVEHHRVCPESLQRPLGPLCVCFSAREHPDTQFGNRSGRRPGSSPSLFVCLFT